MSSLTGQHMLVPVLDGNEARWDSALAFAVPGNPLDEITVTEDVRFVMLGGRVLKYAGTRRVDTRPER